MRITWIFADESPCTMLALELALLLLMNDSCSGLSRICLDEQHLCGINQIENKMRGIGRRSR